MAGESMRKLGLKIKTSAKPVSQILGQYEFKTFWGRHVRWGRIRKSHAPLAFAAEPFFGTVPMSLMGAYGMTHFTPLSFLAAFFIAWGSYGIFDGYCYFRTTRVRRAFTLDFPGIWAVRELLSFPLWVKIASGNGIDWLGNQFRLAQGGILLDN